MGTRAEGYYLAEEYAMSSGVGVSEKRLPSFDKALLDANVGNYNLVRLSSILPAHCKRVNINDIQKHIPEGSLLPTAYATISCSEYGQKLASAIGVGYPADDSKVGVIMEYSNTGITGKQAEETIREMVREAFWERRWELDRIEVISAEAVVEKEGSTVSTFACIAEW